MSAERGPRAAVAVTALEGLASIPGVRVHGPASAADKVGVVPFTVEGIDHGLVAAILGDQHGIGVRNGCFCAHHPYIAHLLGLSRLAVQRWATLSAMATSATPRAWCG